MFAELVPNKGTLLSEKQASCKPRETRFILPVFTSLFLGILVLRALFFGKSLSKISL